MTPIKDHHFLFLIFLQFGLKIHIGQHGVAASKATVKSFAMMVLDQENKKEEESLAEQQLNGLVQIFKIFVVIY